MQLLKFVCFQRVHPTQISRYEVLVESRKKQHATDASSERPTKRQATLNETDVLRVNSVISQAALDDIILDHIIEDLQPFSMTEKPSFRRLILRLAPNRTLICRKTIMSRLELRAEAMKQHLIEILHKVSWVSTTTDCWSAHHRAFIGVTVHWIDEESMTRKAAALACKRLKGSHTFDVIAESLESIHSTYQIQNKIIKTTTDNGSNFCKAFSVFGKAEVDGTLLQESAQLGTAEINGDEDNNADEEWEYHGIEDIIAAADSTEGAQYTLPPHQRCACHTLNLIATRDATEAESDTAYKKIYRSTFAKCLAMWNKQSRSTLSADDIEATLMKRLVIPNQTRWNSTYDAMERMYELFNEKGIATMNTLCDKLQVPNFSANEIQFVSEFVAVTKPLLQALNILQCELKAFMAYLLPTLVALKEKLQLLEAGASVTVRMCKPLVRALLTGIEDRFGGSFMDKDLIAAAIVHPKFKTMWIKDAEQHRVGLEHIKRLLEVQLHRMASQHTDASTAQDVHSQSFADDDDGFFTFHQQQDINSNADAILANFMSSNSVNSVKELRLFPAIQKIFIELNTALPASAACERLFSTAGRVFRPSRCSMSDKHFEQQLLLRANFVLK